MRRSYLQIFTRCPTPVPNDPLASVYATRNNHPVIKILINPIATAESRTCGMVETDRILWDALALAVLNEPTGNVFRTFYIVLNLDTFLSAVIVGTIFSEFFSVLQTPRPVFV